MRIENVVMIIPYSPLGSLKYNYQAAALKPTREVHFHTAHIQILEFIGLISVNVTKKKVANICKKANHSLVTQRHRYDLWLRTVNCLIHNERASTERMKKHHYLPDQFLMFSILQLCKVLFYLSSPCKLMFVAYELLYPSQMVHILLLQL